MESSRRKLDDFVYRLVEIAAEDTAITDIADVEEAAEVEAFVL